MNQEETKKESTISKAILDSISFPTQALKKILKTNSSPNIISKTLTLSLPEDDKSSEEKDSDSNREYKIGNYMVKYTLGKGTFGKVKLGIYIPNNEKVAIKILEKNRIVEKDDEIRVKREFDMLAQFSHPNVILVAEIFESEDSYYSVMEFCEGGELFNYIVKKNRLSEDESAFFFFQLINGLEYIHSLGIVHRDLKPENLLLTSDHILKIIDFGLSNYFKTGQKNLLSTPCGSPCYASPEMVAGKKYDGFKIDVWSCGIILYAMLCGYLPFEDPDNEVLFKKILECKLDFPGYVNKLSIDLIEKILVTDPDKRITIPDIKRHPFYLKGKDIFEEGFSINQIMQNPIEKNMSEKNSEMRDNNVNNNEENKKEKTIEEISVDVNSENNDNNINDNKGINNNQKIIEIDINDFKKDNVADIGIKNINNNNDDNINNKENKDVNERNKRLEKKDKKENIKKKKRKLNNRENMRNNENINNNLENKDINSITNKNEKKQKALNIKINLDNKLKKEEDDNKNSNYNKNVVPTEQENVYMPLNTEYNILNLRFNTLENVKDIKENKNEKLNLTKKIDNNELFKSREKNLKKYFELKPNEKSKSKSKSKSKTKEKSLDKSKEKTEDKRKNKKTLTPKKIFHISKKVKSQRPSDIKNLSKKVNINLKINPKKYLQQKYQHLEKLISAKDPKKMKTNFGNTNININLSNKYTNYTPSQIKGILNTFNSKNKKLSEDHKDNNFQPLKTETNNINIKNKNIANKNNFINNTIDPKKYKFGYTISDIKKVVIKSRIKKADLFSINLREKKKLSDIRRIKSSTFNNENNNITNLNNKTFQIKPQAYQNKKIKMVRNKPNELIYNINNLSSNKSPFDINITENNNTNNIIRTEPSSDINTKISNYQGKGPILNPKTHFKILRKTNTNLNSLGYNNKNINPTRSNLYYRRSYLKYLNNIRKAPTYNLLKTVNLKNLPLTSKQRKNPYQMKNNENLSKKNQQVTIRNTVINFNMIDTGIILPSVKNVKNSKKINSTYNTNPNNSISLKPKKKYSKDITTLNAMNTLNNFGNYQSINTLNQENKYNNTINKFSNINTETNKMNSLSSFNRLVNKMKNKQKLNKIKFKNLNINNIKNTNTNTNNTNLDKIHNKFKSMKLNDYFKTGSEKKNLETSGINNHTLVNSSNNTIISMNNGIRNITDDKNFTLNSFMNKNKKYFIPKGKGYLIKQTGKINKLINNYKRRNNLSGNSNNTNLSENFKQFSIKGINS